MKSRMDRYYDASLVEKENNGATENQNCVSRTKKNDQLYKEVSSLKIESFDVNSNVSVIGQNSKNIDIQDVQKILDEKYHEKSKKRSFGDAEMRDIPKINLDETREYDINSIIEKARTNKEVNYEEDRLKKLRNTQYDILKKIDVDEKTQDSKEELVKKSRTGAKRTNKELLSLIDTITTKELINEKAIKTSAKNFEKSLKEDTAEIVIKKDAKKVVPKNDTILDNTLASSSTDLDPLDILSDLRGDNENTRVLGINDLKKTEESIILDRNLVKDLEETKVKESVLKKQLEEDMDDTLDDKKIKETEKLLKEEKEKERSVTSTITTLGKDNSFDDFADLRDDMKFTKILVKVLIIIIVIIFIVGCIFLANKFMGLGLF